MMGTKHKSVCVCVCVCTNITIHVDKKLARIKTAPVVEKEAAMAEDAAGFRK